MQLSLALLAAGASMLQPALANFDIYMVDTYGGIFKSHQMGYQIFDAEPSSCDEVRQRHVFWASGDVSKQEGVRCKGSGCSYTPPAGDIDQLEMNFHSSAPVWHWTIYKDRGFSMYGLDGNAYGNCIVFPNGDYECDLDGGVRYHGYRKFRCLTQYTVNQILGN